MKILLLTDTHYQESDFLTNLHIQHLERCIQYISENDIDVIIHLGDFGEKSKHLDNKTLDKIKKRYCDMIDMVQRIYFISGNHDNYYKNSTEITSAKSHFMGVQKVKFVNKKPVVISDEENDIKYVLVPWINEENQEICMESLMKNSNRKNIVLGHFELAGFKIMGHEMDSDFDGSVLDDYKSVISGHYHTYQAKDNIVYIGSPYQLEFGDGQNHRTFMLDVNKLKELEKHENYFFDIDITEDEIESDTFKEKVKHIGGKYVRLYLKTSNQIFINRVLDFVDKKVPQFLKVFYLDVNFQNIEIENLNINDDDIEKEFFEQLELDKTKKDELEKRFNNYKKADNKLSKTTPNTK